MFCYCSLLVEAGLVDEVYLSFLVVGHTHCNLDQEFSLHSKYISKSAWIGSPLAMQELYLSSYSQAQEEKLKKGEDDGRITISIQLRYVFDWKEFFAPVVNKNIKYFQIPHRFRIKLCGERAICQYMLFTHETLGSELWLPAVPSSQVTTDPLLQQAYIQLHDLAVVNGLPDLRRFMGLKGDIEGYISTTRSSDSEETLALANTLNSLMSELLELEKVALASTIVNFDIQEDGSNERCPDYAALVRKSKADIQREMIRSGGAKAGYLIWLDYTRDQTWNGLARPRILPRILAPGERVNDADKKVVESARAIASVAASMLVKIEHKAVAIGVNSSSIQIATDDYTNKVLHPMEKDWYEARKTFEQVLQISKFNFCFY